MRDRVEKRRVKRMSVHSESWLRWNGKRLSAVVWNAKDCACIFDCSVRVCMKDGENVCWIVSLAYSLPAKCCVVWKGGLHLI